MHPDTIGCTRDPPLALSIELLNLLPEGGPLGACCNPGGLGGGSPQTSGGRPQWGVGAPQFRESEPPITGSL